MTRIEELESAYCDLHKDVHGVKARWIRFATEAEGLAALDRLQAEGEIVWAEERTRQEAAAVAFEQRVNDTIALGAWTRDNAIRWIHEAEETGGDDEYLCWKLGMRYGYFRKAA
jgi:hypothetical protein